MHNGRCFHTDQTNCHTASSRQASPRPCNWCKQVNIHADCVFTALSCVQVPPLPSQGGQSAQLPPLLSASVHSQQDSPQLGISCAASFMMHKSANSPFLSTGARTSSPSHPLFSHSTFQQPQLTSHLGACSVGNATHCTAAAGHSLTKCNSGSLAAMQPVTQLYCSSLELPLSIAVVRNFYADGLSSSSCNARPQEQQQQQNMAAGAAANSDHSRCQSESSTAAVAEIGRGHPLSTSRPWTVSNQASQWQTQEALSVLNSADLAFLASRAPSSLSHCASCSESSTSQEATSWGQPDVSPAANCARCSRGAATAVSTSKDVGYDSLEQKTGYKGSDSSAGKRVCSERCACSTSEQLLKGLVAAPWQDLQSLADQCHDTDCNVDAHVNSVCGSSADTSYSDDDWELPSNIAGGGNQLKWW